MPFHCCTQVEGGDFTWEAGSAEASLSGVSFTAAPGTLTMVVGSVGSGKSSILAALIGQMERVKGTVAVGGRVAYVAQTAWIVNDSVQVSHCLESLQSELWGGWFVLFAAGRAHCVDCQNTAMCCSKHRVVCAFQQCNMRVFISIIKSKQLACTVFGLLSIDVVYLPFSCAAWCLQEIVIMGEAFEPSHHWNIVEANTLIGSDPILLSADVVLLRCHLLAGKRDHG
jgi:hypothetical protein